MKKNMLLLLLFVSSVALGQTVVLSGKIVDTNKQPVNFGDAFLLSTKDSSLIKYAPVKADGFVFDAVQKGSYLLRISCLGFEERIEPLVLSEDKNLVIPLNAATATLKEVSVKSSRKTFTNTHGNTKVSIENSPFASIPNPVELLSKLPAIQVSPTGESVSIIGKGEPLIYIENQRVSIADLNALSVNDIKTIEIINNPSAKYEAAGRAVILITRKANKREGLKVDLSETASVRKYLTNRVAVDVNMKKKKLEVKTNLQYNQIKNWEGNAYDFRINSQNVQSGYDVTAVTTRPQFIVGTGAYYQMDDDNNISINTTIRSQTETFPINTNSVLKNNSVDDHVLTNSFNKGNRLFTTTNLNYNRNFKKLEAQLFVGAQYSTLDQTVQSNIFDNHNNTQFNLSQERNQKNKVGVFTARADVEKTFKNKMKLETGVNFSAPTSTSLADIEKYNPVSSTHSNYQYNEKDYAAYTQLSGSIKKVDYAVGIRLETTDVKGKFKDSVSLLVNSNNTQFFPKINIDIPIDSLLTLNLNYAKTIERPNFSSITEVTTYINPYFEWSNNTHIVPSINNEISATLQHKEKSLRVTYYKRNNPVYANFNYNPSAVLLTRVDKNYQSESGVDVNISFPVKYKLWVSNNTITGGISKVQDPFAEEQNATPYLYAYSFNQFNLSKNLIFAITAWGLTKRSEGAFERNGQFAVDTSISKKFYDKINCTFSFNNIFNSLSYKEAFTINDVKANGVYYDTSSVSLAIKYSFGKIKNPSFKNKQVDENSGRMN